MESATALTTRSPDAVVVGSGPNGLAAALTLARAGLTVSVYEGAETPGGGCRTAELTAPGFRHDICSAVHPLLAASPFFRSTGLKGVTLKSSAVALAHPLDGGQAATITRSVEQTAASLSGDAAAYRRLVGPLVDGAEAIIPTVLAPLLRRPPYPLALARFVSRGILPITVLARAFETKGARALLAGLGAHSMQPLNAAGTGAIGLFLGMLAHVVGWPVVEGGSGRLVDALLEELVGVGGQLHAGRPITDLDELPGSRITLLDVAAQGLLHLAGARLPSRYRAALRRFRYGPGVCKLDWALDGPVPWEAESCGASPTVHIGGTLEEIVRSESEVARGRHAERPFCIAVQPCVVDPSRAPAGHHTCYAYCHVPPGSTVDMSDRIEAQIERFAPGFRDRVLERHTTTAAEIGRDNPNYVGGDINSGAATLRQAIFRPVVALNPYRTPIHRLYLCSSSAPPGGGVHGMCGMGAAQSALRDLGL
jgi:phytoene dehydrogenase-like protein